MRTAISKEAENMRVLLIEPDAYPKAVSIDGGLKSMQDLVGGLIQAIYPFEDPVAIICNEEGKLEGLEPNRALRHPETRQVYDIICGSFFICGLGEDDFISLSPELMKKYEQEFHYPELFIPCCRDIPS